MQHPQSAAGHIAGLFVSRGGVPKMPVRAADVGPDGLAGDAVKHKKIHGGPTRALCLFSADVLAALAAEGHPIQPGWVGENVLLADIDWRAVQIGSRLALGANVTLEVTSFTPPCKQIAAAFIQRRFRRILHSAHPGWSRVYVRVLSLGSVQIGDPARLL